MFEVWVLNLYLNYFLFKHHHNPTLKPTDNPITPIGRNIAIYIT